MERQILFDPNPTTASVPYAAKDKVIQLVPKDGTLAECRAVMMAKVSKCSGLFITMSRINHDCMGNSNHYFNTRRGVKILVASKRISRGEEYFRTLQASCPPNANDSSTTIPVHLYLLHLSRF